MILRSVEINYPPNHFLIRCAMFFRLLLKNSILALLKEIVTLTFSSFITRRSGGGRKSLTTFNLPTGSSVYFILFFINVFPLSPVSCPENADNITSIRESYGHNAVIDSADTVKSVLPATVRYIFSNYTVRVKKSSLGQRKRDMVFGVILPVLLLIPLEADLLHENNILR